jgi:tRNA1(Val) A37 N6-methylase TrmN6
MSPLTALTTHEIKKDLGAVLGAFVGAAFERLTALGASSMAAADQLHAVESYQEHYTALAESLQQTGRPLPHLHHSDLFNVQFPQTDAVIGNPPYVIRHRLTDSQDIRLKVSLRVGYELRKQQADLYSYFIMYAGSFLKEGGRLALIISDSWLDMNFGIELKRFLLHYFKINAVISFDKRVFPEALVKTVILLAERTAKPKARESVHFIRIKRSIALPDIEHYLASDRAHNNGLKISIAPQGTLDPREYWGVYFKAPELYFQLSAHPQFTRLGELAETRIGLQTLARKFYILPESVLKEQQLERRFFEPVAVSPRELDAPVLDKTTPLENVVLLCPKHKAELRGTNVLKYIETAEQSTVEIRTLHKEAKGYNNLPRLQRAGRDPWYDLRTETNRRGRYPILLPRRVYQKFSVVWNKAAVIPNEDFLEARPRDSEHLFLLHAVLNSSFGEFMIRSVGHIYGGGVCNLNPSDLKTLPVLNVGRLDEQARQTLTNAYNEFIAARGADPTILDKAMFQILDDCPAPKPFYAALKELRSLSTTLKNS